MAKEKQPILYLIEWDDAFSNSASWMDEEDQEAFANRTYTCWTVGFVVKETKKAIVVATSLAHTNGTRGGLWSIPKGMIRRKKRLKF